jgi:hypothetical protein
MSSQQQIKNLVKEADVYRQQGLLAQSKETYLKVLTLLENTGNGGNRKKLVDAIAARIKQVDRDLETDKADQGRPQLSEDVQELIRNVFSFSPDSEKAAVEGVIALAKFGQYERALVDFRKLLKKGIMPLVVAKNILRCHLALSSPNEAIDQYEQWLSSDLLSKQDLGNLRVFLGNILERKGIEANLPVVEEGFVDDEHGSSQESEFLDISSVGVKLTAGPQTGQMVEFDVTFQSGNVISVVVPSREEEVVKSFKPGTALPDIQLFSPIAILRGKGTVSGKTKIKSGPQEGDYMFDIKIQSA